MAKLKQDPIKEKDILEYAESYSDFAFELKVLEKITKLEFQCEHSGTYTDPITGKPREFDIRALRKTSFKNFRRVRLSIECKNLKPNFPLVAHSVPRKPNESYHDLLYVFEPGTPSGYNPFSEFSKTIRWKGLYKEGEFVAKSLDQVGRHPENSTIVSSSADVFEKVSQAINSAYELIERAFHESAKVAAHLNLIVPILVIPSDALWQINYKEDGSRISVEKIGRASYFIGKTWTVGTSPSIEEYTISHMEIVTFPEVDVLINELFKNLDNLDVIMPVIHPGAKKPIPLKEDETIYKKYRGVE